MYKKILLVLVLIISSIITTNLPVLAQSNPDALCVFPAQYNVAKDKVWTITFNREIDPSDSLEDYIQVSDSHDNLIGVTSAFASDGMSITVTPPVGGYVPNQTYVLNIYKGLKYKTGELISQSAKMEFSIANNVSVPPLTVSESCYQEINDPIKTVP